MKRLLLTLSVLAVTGCASYYSDPYYSDRYYDDGNYYSAAPYSARPWVYSSWHYDLYDPYSTLFYPMAYLYDPWFWNDYRFGVHRYPSRLWSFSFYGGRPWFYSPWYGGYGLYHPYGYQYHAGRRETGVPSYAVRGGGESAQTAARGMAAEVHSGAAGLSNSIVRSSAVRVSQVPGYRAQLLGTMATPGTRINESPDPSFSAPGTPGYTRGGGLDGYQGRTAGPGAQNGAFRSEDGLPLERAGFRNYGGNTVGRDAPRVESINGMPTGSAGLPQPLRSGEPMPAQYRSFPGRDLNRPGMGSGTIWRDNAPGSNRGFRGNSSAPSSTMDRGPSRSFPSASPRIDPAPSAGSARSESRSGRDHD